MPPKPSTPPNSIRRLRCQPKPLNPLPADLIASITPSIFPTSAYLTYFSPSAHAPGAAVHLSAAGGSAIRIEGQSRRRLSLRAQSHLIHAIPSILIRFDSITTLSLRNNDFPSVSIGDEALILISLNWKNLKSLTLREITADGIESFSSNCKSLKKFSCTFCSFGSRGIKAVIDNCAGLEELRVNRLTGITDLIGPGAAGSSLKLINLKNISIGGPCFCPLIRASNSLRALKLISCPGDWSTLLQAVGGNGAKELRMLHLERVRVSGRVLIRPSFVFLNLDGRIIYKNMSPVRRFVI